MENPNSPIEVIDETNKLPAIARVFNDETGDFRERLVQAVVQGVWLPDLSVLVLRYELLTVGFGTKLQPAISESFSCTLSQARRLAINNADTWYHIAPDSVARYNTQQERLEREWSRTL